MMHIHWGSAIIHVPSFLALSYYQQVSLALGLKDAILN